MTKQEKKKPVRVFGIGNVSASIFEQTANDRRSFHTVSLQRSWLDEEEQRQYSSSLALADLPAAVEVLRMAMSFIATDQGEAVRYEGSDPK
jgi:hypothetical protein